ncbi:MAG: hypothetical protein ABR548_04150 [Actinomycetota bacterium]|nr:hypothetical protein [Actinomycetota bacterium]
MAQPFILPALLFPVGAAIDAQASSQQAIYAGLDALLSVVPLDLCAYLHLPASSGPQLYLRRPDLSGLDSSAAFNLFGALRDAAASDRPEIPGYNTVFVSTSGPGSRGLHAIGRRDEKLDEHERAIIDALCRATAAVAHTMESTQKRYEPGRVAVEITGDIVNAHVEVLAGDERWTGRAERATAHEAVCAAALDAVHPEVSLTAARPVDIGDAKAAVVLVEGASTQRLGSALYQENGDPLFAFAVAALEAAESVPAPRD